MKIAIIGANGFIGTRLVEHFHLGGLNEVAPIVRRPVSLALPARFAIDWRIGDALDANSLAQALAGCDAIVHAAIGDPRQIEAMPAILAEAAARAGIKRVVYLSTASVHGQSPEPGTNESSPLHTGHALEYNDAKIRAERSFHTACQRHGLAGFALRPGVVFGPRSRWITDLATDLRSGRAWLLDEGRGICNSIYVDNLVAAVEAALTADAKHAGAYLVGDEETVTWREFYGGVATALGIDPATIPPLKNIPDFTPGTAARLQSLAATPAVQSVLPLVPGIAKRTVKNLLVAAQRPPAVDAWTLPAAPGPRVTQELVLLQQCRVKLPHTKAAQALNYRAPVTFATGLARSLAWLAFAEGRA
jgi:Nucleoside-diphosphate-sugar epimerases